jgi:hypothetical protein
MVPVFEARNSIETNQPLKGNHEEQSFVPPVVCRISLHINAGARSAMLWKLSVVSRAER